MNVLRLEPLLFPVEFSSHRVRVLVDGKDVVTAAYPNGWYGLPLAGFAPEWLLGPTGQLAIGDEARTVALGGSDTTEDELMVHLHREHNQVVWSGWQILDMGHLRYAEAATGLGTFRFDTIDYADELVRATARAQRVWHAGEAGQTGVSQSP